MNKLINSGLFFFISLILNTTNTTAQLNSCKGFYDLLNKNDFKACENYIDTSVNLGNCEVYLKKTPLEELLLIGQITLAKRLVNKGGQISANSIIITIVKNKYDLLELLLAKGANPNVKGLYKGNPNKANRLPIQYAVEKTDSVFQFVDLLLKYHSPVEDALNADIRNTPDSVIYYLIKQGAKPEYVNIHFTYLSKSKNKYELIEDFLKKNANPNAKYQGSSILEAGITKKDLKLVNLLCQYNADLGNRELYKSNFTNFLSIALDVIHEEELNRKTTLPQDSNSYKILAILIEKCKSEQAFKEFAEDLYKFPHLLTFCMKHGLKPQYINLKNVTSPVLIKELGAFGADIKTVDLGYVVNNSNYSSLNEILKLKVNLNNGFPLYQAYLRKEKDKLILLLQSGTNPSVDGDLIYQLYMSNDQEYKKIIFEHPNYVIDYYAKFLYQKKKAGKDGYFDMTTTEEVTENWGAFLWDQMTYTATSSKAIEYINLQLSLKKPVVAWPIYSLFTNPKLGDNFKQSYLKHLVEDTVYYSSKYHYNLKVFVKDAILAKDFKLTNLILDAHPNEFKMGAVDLLQNGDSTVVNYIEKYKIFDDEYANTTFMKMSLAGYRITPLMMAVNLGYFSLAKTMIDSGADIHKKAVKNEFKIKNELTILEIAKKANVNDEFYNYLKKVYSQTKK